MPIQLQQAGVGRGRGKPPPLPFTKRFQNIKWVADLSREGLSFNEKTRKILIHTTSQDERLYIAFPGKESVRTREPMPWDFSPVYDHDTRDLGSLTFGDIWEILYHNLIEQDHFSEGEKKHLAFLFYKNAFLYDHIEKKETVFSSEDYIYSTQTRLSNEDFDTRENLYHFQAHEEDINLLSKCLFIPNSTVKISVEGFLVYNDLLCWNEDCKYYYKKIIKYRNVETPDMKVNEPGFFFLDESRLTSSQWIVKTGRVNTWLTHLNMINWALGGITFSSLLDSMSRGRGVAPISDKVLREELISDYLVD